MLLIGSRHRRDSCSEAYRFARSGPSQPTRRSTSTSRTPLMGFIDRPFADTTVLRPHPPGPSPRLRFGTATSRTCSVRAVPPGFNGFLRRGQIRRSTPSTACGFVAPRNRPWGSPRFGLPDSASRPSLDPKVADPKVRRESSPWRTPFEAFPSSTAFDHAVTARRPFGLGRVHRLACPLAVSSHARYRVATVRCSARRPQGFLPSRSPLQARDVSAARPLDAPLGFGSTRFPMLPRVSRRPDTLDVSPCGPAASASPTRTSGEGKVFRPCLAPCDRRSIVPEGTTVCGRGGSGTFRRRHLGRIPHGPRRNRWDAGGSARRRIHRVGPAPEGAGCRRDRDASPKRLVRDPVLTPKSGTGGSSFCSASLGARART